MNIPIIERQFTALAKVAGITSSAAGHKAMKLIFVHGKTAADAVRETGLTAGYVSNAKNKMIGAYSQIPQRIALLREALGE